MTGNVVGRMKLRCITMEERSGNLEFPFKSICKCSHVNKRAIAR